MRNFVLVSAIVVCFLSASSYALGGEKDKATVTEDQTKPLVRVEKRVDHSYVVGTVIVNARIESIWDILVDYHNAPQVFQNLKSCEVVGKKGNAKLVRQVVRTGSPIKFDYTVALTEEKPNLITWRHESGSLEEVTGSWLLEPLDSGAKTKVTYSIFIDGGIFLPPWLLTNQLKGYLPVVLEALRKKAESLAKT
jgi:uncharacterized membrane protein